MPKARELQASGRHGVQRPAVGLDLTVRGVPVHPFGRQERLVDDGVHDEAADEHQHEAAGEPDAALRGALEVHGPAVGFIAVVETVEAVEGEVGDRKDGEEAEEPPGRDHVRGVPERVVDDLYEEERRDAEHDGDRDGDLGGRAEGAREALPVRVLREGTPGGEPEGAEHHVDGREVKGESDDAEHQEDERVCGRAGGIRQSHEHHVIHLAAPFLGRMDSM